jgi:hypothetical protein
MNASRELVVDENIEVPTGPNVESGVDDPLFKVNHLEPWLTLL